MEAGVYYINVHNEVLIDPKGNDVSEHITDFSKFRDLGIDYDGDIIFLANIAGVLKFFKLPITANVNLSDVTDPILDENWFRFA